MRPAQRILTPAPAYPLQRHVRSHHAMHDPELGQAPERLQPRPPHPVLEGGLGHGGHARPQQQLEHAEEDGQGPHGELVAHGRDEPGAGVHHSFLDLVPADHRAPHGLGQPVRQRRLAGPGGAADHHQRGKTGHATECRDKPLTRRAP